jgi:hypothetical protein
MLVDIRNKYGFPIIAKVESVRDYASDAKLRNHMQEICPQCRQAEKLQGVIQITNNWSKK